MESSRDLIPEYVYSRQAEFENSEVYSRTTADRRLFLREISPEEGDAHDVQRLLSGGGTAPRLQYSAKVQEITTYILEHLPSELTVNQLAELLFQGVLPVFGRRRSICFLIKPFL